MTKTIMLAAVPALFALSACSETTSEAAPEAVALEDDNDAAEPIAAPVGDEEPHDESVPHDH